MAAPRRLAAASCADRRPAQQRGIEVAEVVDVAAHAGRRVAPTSTAPGCHRGAPRSRHRSAGRSRRQGAAYNVVPMPAWSRTNAAPAPATSCQRGVEVGGPQRRAGRRTARRAALRASAARPPRRPARRRGVEVVADAVGDHLAPERRASSRGEAASSVTARTAATPGVRRGRPRRCPGRRPRRGRGAGRRRGRRSRDLPHGGRLDRHDDARAVGGHRGHRADPPIRHSVPVGPHRVDRVACSRRRRVRRAREQRRGRVAVRSKLSRSGAGRSPLRRRSSSRRCSRDVAHVDRRREDPGHRRLHRGRQPHLPRRPADCRRTSSTTTAGSRATSRSPACSRNKALGGFLHVRRPDPRRAAEPQRRRCVRRRGRARSRDGECIVVYPEGTLTRDPDLWPMKGKTGAARIALATGCPVIPVGQWGAQEVLPPYTKRPHLVPRKHIVMKAGDPVRPRGPAGHRRVRRGRRRRRPTGSWRRSRRSWPTCAARPPAEQRFDPRRRGVRETGNPHDKPDEAHGRRGSARR